MKILFFSHSSGLGGAERSLLALVDELLDLNTECFLVFPHDGPLVTEIKERQLPFAIVDYAWWCDQKEVSGYEATRRSWYSLNALFDAHELLDSWNADIVFTNSITIPWGAVYARQAKKPHILQVREFGELDFAFQFFAGYEESVEFLAQNSEFVLTNSKATLKHFKERMPNTKMDFVYPSVRRPSRDEGAIAGKVFKNEKALKLLVTGSLTAAKGQMDAVQAASLLNDQNIASELILLGSQTDTEYVQALKDMVAELGLERIVQLLGFVKEPLPYIRQADVVLTCSRNEAFGRSTLEAMALGKLVIGANSGGTKEIITHGKNGALYEPGNPRDLAEKILTLQKDRSLASEIKKAAKERYKELQDTSNLGKKTYNIIVKTILKTKMQPENKTTLSSSSILELLGLVEFPQAKSWSDIKRSLISNRILFFLHPESISQRLRPSQA